MRLFNFSRNNLLLLGLLSLIIIIAAGCSSSTPSLSAYPYTLNVSLNPKIGSNLVDDTGRSIYYFARDMVGKSNADQSVLQEWPIFYARDITVDPSLNQKDFSEITRSDGNKQTTYKGWPLYYYSKDKVPGDLMGEGIAGIWFAVKVPFYTVMLQTKPDTGDYLVDSAGMSLYYFIKDSAGKSTADSTILANWPIFNVVNFSVVSSVKAADFANIKREDGKNQTTYKGWPLYYYIQDKVSGDTLGQGLNGSWFLINPANISPATIPSS